MNKEIDCAYFCLTQFQLINVLNLAINQKDKKSDLYILNTYIDNIYELKKRLQEIHIFNSIKIIDESLYWPTSKNMILSNLNKVFNYIRASKVVKNIIGNTIYKEIYLYAKCRPGFLTYLVMQKTQKNTKLIYYEDGIGSYYNPILYQPTNYDCWLRKLCFGNSWTTDTPLYLYSPELYTILDIMPFNNIRQLPSIITNPHMLNTLNHVFDYKKEDKLQEDILILDTLKNRIMDNENVEKAIGLYNMINSELSFANVAIKKHPSDKSKKESKIRVFTQNHNPFEIICLNNDLSNKVLISIASSATLTPKLLFGQEPYIILLHNLFKFKDNYGCESFKVIDDVYKKCKTLYKSQDKFFIPNTVEDLKKCLTYIKSKLQQTA